MAAITVQLHTAFRKKLDRDCVSLDAATPADALAALEKMFGEKFTALLCDSSGEIKSHYMFILNGEVLDRAQLKKTKLKNGDSLSIFAPVGGG